MLCKSTLGTYHVALRRAVMYSIIGPGLLASALKQTNRTSFHSIPVYLFLILSPLDVITVNKVSVFRYIMTCISSVWYIMHRASSCNMYINQQDSQNSCDQTLFSIRCSTCFGLYQSIFSSNFISCTSHLVYAGTSGCCVAIATQQPDVSAYTGIYQMACAAYKISS